MVDAESGTKVSRSLQSYLKLVLLFSGLVTGSCLRSRSEQNQSPQDQTVIQNIGSDTMVNLAQAWAEEYAVIQPLVSVEVSGGGTGTGVAALINGTVDIANCSRKLEPIEIERAQQNTGQPPLEFLVGYDALAVYVHKDNPLAEISMEALAEIYGENGHFSRWSQLGVHLPKGVSDEIIIVSRQSNSGTYHYFRETILGKKRDFRLGTIDMHGSKDVVELVARTLSAIGYSGMGYATAQVKMLKVCRKTGEPAFTPSIANTQQELYPISRPLFMYTLGQPTGHIREYLDWILADAGQKIVAVSGYIPLRSIE
ncbi:phosphate ABC transporter substrate-binding protein [candidate division KSB1 bacterium]|nr:phosphate ABC transporter substrate-binding protein [candidate division KSB1 bacterium]